jgi:hypothetical protein
MTKQMLSVVIFTVAVGEALVLAGLRLRLREVILFDLSLTLAFFFRHQRADCVLISSRLIGLQYFLDRRQ